VTVLAIGETAMVTFARPRPELRGRLAAFR
jgi:hypothetical protein